MTLFLSTTTNKVDAKGRVSVPAGFRAALQNDAFQGVVLLPSTKFAALEGFSMTMMTGLAQRLDRFDLFSEAQDDLASVLFANAVALGTDDTGRIGIPKNLLAHAGITDMAVFVGLGTKFQIWSPERYAARAIDATRNVAAQKMTVPHTGGGA